MKKKIISIVLIVLLIIVLFQSITYGATFNFSAQVQNTMTGTGDSKVLDPVNNIAGTAITVAQVIAVGVAIVMLIVLAMKYMVSAPGDRATIKKHAVVYIVGAVVMFAATGILGIIKELAKAFT